MRRREAASDVTELDVIVIGAGQPGPGVAAAKAQQGLRVALIEMEQVGGTCLNHGCKPTKALRASATVAHTARRAQEYGVHTGEVTVDFGAAIGRVHRIIDGLRDGLVDWISGVDGLELIPGTATLRTDPSGGRHRVEVKGRTLIAPEIYLNLGSRAGVPPIAGLDDVDYLTEVELLQLTALPEHLIIVGGGYIGLEFGQMFRRFGLAGHHAGRRRHRHPRGRRRVRRSSPITSPTRASTSATPGRPGSWPATTAEWPSSSTTDRPVTGSHLLVATGRRSNSDLLGPEHGIETDDRGFFTIDSRFATSVPGVWALGDVNGHGAFTHTAYQDGQILLDPDRSLDGRITAYALYTDPPLGRVGMTMDEARKSGRRVLKAEVPMSSVSRAVLESETVGLMRILVDADSEEFLGATILGLHGDDLVQQIGLAMQAGVKYPAVQQALPIHPTMAEYHPVGARLAAAAGLSPPTADPSHLQRHAVESAEDVTVSGGGALGWRRYVDTYGLSVTQNRHGRSAACCTPTRGPALYGDRAGGRLQGHRAGAEDVGALVYGGEPQRLGQPARPPGQIPIGRPAPATARLLQPGDHLAGPQQHPRGHAVRPADHVGRPVHPVREVDVQMPRRSEHHRVPRGPAAIGVRRRIRRAVVRLDLDEPDGDRSVPQHRPQQAGRDLVDRRGQLLPRQRRVKSVTGQASSRARRARGASTSTVPAEPSTRTRSPVRDAPWWRCRSRPPPGCPVRGPRWRRGTAAPRHR